MLRVVFVCGDVSQRRDIVTGSVEPTDEECEWQSDRDEEEELAVSSHWVHVTRSFFGNVCIFAAELISSYFLKLYVHNKKRIVNILLIRCFILIRRTFIGTSKATAVLFHPVTHYFRRKSVFSFLLFSSPVGGGKGKGFH